MKATLLLTLGLTVGALGFSQSLYRTDFNAAKAKSAQANLDLAQGTGAGPVLQNKSSKSISSIGIGYSGNVYTSLVETQHSLTAHEGLNIIQLIHRAKVGDHAAISSGDIMSTVSYDGGATWNSKLVISNATGKGNRYPSGAIFNPTGNTVANQAYTVFAGPATDGTNWSNNFVGSMRLDSSFNSTQYKTAYGSLVRHGMVANSDGKAHVIGSAYTSTAVGSGYAYNLDTLYLYTGNYNATNHNFDWTINTFKPSFVIESDGGEAATVYEFNMAWSADGVTGYYWTLGRMTATDTRGYMPLVWKTTNSGGTWTLMPIYDFSALTVITDELQPMKGTTQSRPYFNSTDGVVDANGNLHLVSMIRAASSNHDDSLGYSFYVANSNLVNPIFDVYTTSAGSWNALKLGDVYTIAVPAAESGFGTGSNAQGWDMRLQAGINAAGNKIFASWTDTDTSIATVGTAGLPLNLFPDLIVAAWDITNDKRFPATNYSINTNFYGDIFYHYMAPQVFTNGETYTVHISELDITSDPLNPVPHNYLSGVTMSNSDFTSNIGFNEVKNQKVVVGQNRPNPFNGSTMVDVTLNGTQNVSIEVINVAGQKVWTRNYGIRTQGTHNFQINASDLNAGMYFYTVRVGEQSVTRKMIVK